MSATRLPFAFAIAVLAVTSLSQTGCVSTDLVTQLANMSSADAARFRQSQTNTRARNIAAGAGIGAAIGAIAGEGKGAAIGAGAGALAGVVIGEMKAKQQGRQLLADRGLDHLIQYTYGTRRELVQRTQELAAKRQNYQQRIASARASKNTAALASVRREIKSSMASADRSLAKADEAKKKAAAADGTPAEESKLRSETTRLSSSAKELKRERDLLASLYDSIDV
jgi:outer membrane lipoprotein SlyB